MIRPDDHVVFTLAEANTCSKSRDRQFSSSLGLFVLIALALLMPLTALRVYAAPATQPSPATTKPVEPQQNVLAHGSAILWVAQVSQTPATDGNESAEQTRIDFRRTQPAWQHLIDIPTRATALANVGDQLAVLLSSGEWLLVGEDETTNSSGQPLPDGDKIITFASDGDTLWALGFGRPSPPTQASATTKSTSAPAATEPATNPATASNEPPHFTLFALRATGWTPAGGAMVPASIGQQTPVSLAVIDKTPYLAIERADSQIDVLRGGGMEWKTIATVDGPAERGAFKLLANRTPLTLWVTGQSADRLVVLPPDSPARTINLEKTDVPVTDRAAVYWVNQIHELSIADGKLAEQAYNPNSNYAVERRPTLALPAPSAPPYASPLFRGALFVALAFAILASVRRRREMKEATPELENVVLADLSRRLAAGLIDAIPFIAPIVVIVQSIHDRSSSMADPATGSQGTVETFWLFMAALFVYLLHTAISETLTRRTIGKLIMGLRVVSVDGATPDSASLLIRNFLRVVDIGLAGVPLILIVFSPLRQRIGDVAGGTIVIRDRVRPEGNLIEPVKTTVTPPVASDVEPPPAGN